jgi:hypothetical protein
MPLDLKFWTTSLRLQNLRLGQRLRTSDPGTYTAAAAQTQEQRTKRRHDYAGGPSRRCYRCARRTGLPSQPPPAGGYHGLTHGICQSPHLPRASHGPRRVTRRGGPSMRGVVRQTQEGEPWRL